MLVAHTPHGPGDWATSQAMYRDGALGEAGRRSVPYIKGALFLTSLAIPGALVMKISKVGKVASFMRAMGTIRRPAHTTLAYVYEGTRAGTVLSRTLQVRKAMGAAALGHNLINPFETIRYASQGDYKRAGINFLYPLIGVPVYNHLVTGSSSQDLVQNGGPVAPRLPDVTVSKGPHGKPPGKDTDSGMDLTGSRKRVKSNAGTKRKKCGLDKHGRQLYWNGKKCVPFNELRYRW